MIKDIHKKKRLLVISCTERKRHLYDRPALDVYDGPSFRVLRKHPNDGIDVLIISAMYGVVSSESKISEYNLKMTQTRSLDLRKSVSSRINEALSSGIYEEVFFELGKDYINTVTIKPSDFPQIKFTVDSGTIGVRLHNLRNWLEYDKNNSQSIKR